MGLHDFASGDVLTDTQMDEIARQATIICTSTTRPSSPITGMRIYETDLDLVRYWTGAAWRTLPNGILARSIDGSGTGPPIGGTEVNINGSSCTFTSRGSDQIYRYSWRFTLRVATSGLSHFDVWVKKGGTHFENVYPYYVIEPGVGLICTGFTPFAVSAGSTTLNMSIQQITGSTAGEIPAGGAFTIEHLGSI